MSCKWRRRTSSNSLHQEPSEVAPALTSKWNRTSPKGRGMVSPSEIWRRPGRSFCRWFVPLLPLKTQLMIQCHILWEYWPMNLLLPLEPLPLLAASLLEPSLTWSRQPSGSQDFWWLLIPGLTTSVSQKPLTLTCQPLVWVTQTLLCALWTLPSWAMMRELTRWIWCGGCLPQKFCTCMASPVNPHGRSCLIAASTEILKRLQRKSRQQLARLWPRRNFRVDGLLRFCSSCLLHLTWGSEGMQVPPETIQFDWSAQPAAEDWSEAPTAQTTEWVRTTTEWS